MLDVRVLGDFGVQLDGRPIELPRSLRACALLGWLAVHPGMHSRATLAGTLWPDVVDSSARASLRSAIWALRSALGAEGGAHLATDRDGLGLQGPDLRVDVGEFDALVANGHYRDALERCSGPLLERFDDEWVFAAREDHDDQVAKTLRELERTELAAGNIAAAQECARRRVALRPLDEDAARSLMSLLIASDEMAEAADVYRRLSTRLRDELDATPCRDIEKLMDQVRSAGPTTTDEATRPRTAVDGARFVGRDAELQSLRNAWDRTVSGRGQLVIITGEGGIGKTRLLDELSEAGRHRNGIRAVGVADSMAGSQPFGPWAELLLQVIAHTGPAPAPLGREIGRVVPGLVPRGVATEARPSSDPKLERIRFFETVVELLAWACRGRPTLLVLEDLHLADRSTIDLVGYVARRIAGLPIMIAVTWRNLPPRPELDALAGALRSRGLLDANIALTPLAPRLVRELARAIAPLPDAELERVVSVSAGSPLIAAETSRAFARGDPAVGLRDAVRAAMSRLNEPARRFVEVAAVAGRDLGRSEVVGLNQIDDPARAAAEALGADLLREHNGAVGFRHALLREAVYSDISAPVRAQLHGAFAESLRLSPAARRPAETARHFQLAGRNELAAVQFARAATEARRASAVDEAAEYLEKAVELGGDDPDLLIELAEVQAWRGLVDASDRTFTRALSAIAVDDTAAMLNAWLRRGRWMRGALCYPHEARTSYGNALTLLEREDAPDTLGRVEALAGLAWTEAVAGDPKRVDDLLRDANKALGTSPPPDLLTHDIGTTRGFACIRAGKFTDSYGPMIAAAAAATRARRPDMAYGCLANAAAAAACAGEFDRALELSDRCAATVVPNSLIQPAVYILTGRSALFRRLNKLADARAACDEAASLADRVGLADLDGLVQHERGLIALAENDVAAAAELLRTALELRAPVSRPLTRLLYAEALARCGRSADAATELRRVALEPVTPGDFPDTLVARMSFVEGLIARSAGDEPGASRHFDESAAHWRRRVGNDNIGDSYVAVLVDLGRPPISSLVEPEVELARVEAELKRRP